ncbi:MAG TPA: hypothetical protein VNI56_05060, partial [Xanthomonadaceae bacterium]|nr:hypothetical protein [Xanthomonadaceae bacterium]
MTDKQARLWAQGQLHTRQQRWEDAIGAYRAIVGHAPDFVPAWLELSVAHEKMDAYRLARDAALQAAQHPPATPLMALAVARRLRRYEQICALFGYLGQTQLQRVLPLDKLVDLPMYVA